jgi:hypothetical protein
MTSTRAKWVEGVRDLYPNNLDEAANYLGVPAVAEKTGLSPSTITDLLSRAPITSESVLAPISRPAVCIGNQPLYSYEQVDEVTKRQRATGHRHLGGGDKPLSSISPAEAQRRNLVSVEEIASMANAQNVNGVHEQTVRRWARDASDFPPAVALRSREGGHPGVPKVVREKKKVISWLVRHGYRKPEPSGRKAAKTN